MLSKSTVFVLASALGFGLVAFARAAARRRAKSVFRDALTPEDLAEADALRAIADDAPLSGASADLDWAAGEAPIETPAGLDPTGGDEDNQHYDAVPVDELATEWLTRAVQGGGTREPGSGER